MTPAEALLLLTLAAVPVAFAGLTAIGERHRGGSVPVTFVAALFFPVTWIVWHARDEPRAARQPSCSNSDTTIPSGPRT